MSTGGDGRADMASLTLTDSTVVILSTDMLSDLSKHANGALPAYARPKFIRVQREFDMTSTYKQQKMALVRDGFDVNTVKDPVYYLNPTTQAYEPLMTNVYESIVKRKLQL